jgi:photosystem II stability/assembly factor-like uncharacterized protein
MKKLFYLFPICLILGSFCGFRGCSGDGEGILEVLASLIVEPGRGSSNDQPIEAFSITCGINGKIFTSDGRPPAPWILRQSGVSQNLNAAGCLQNFDSTVAYIVGNQGVILRTFDKGHNWAIIRTPNQSQPNLNGVGVIPPQGPGFTKIIAVGNSGTVLKSDNFGGYWKWNEININTTKKLNSVAVAANLIFAVVGDSGAIYRTLDGGANWENRSISPTVSLKKITSITYNSYCAVGTNGSIYKSTDYGYSWVLRSSGTTRTFRDVYFSGIDSGICAGDFGAVRLTTNGGLTWFTDSYLSGLTTRNILSFARVDGNTFNSITTSSTPGDNAVDTTFFLAVSSEPFIGIEPISNFIAEVFSLKQNYPNPFNPVTKIRFDVAAGTEYIEPVQIIVYDISGREVTILVNEQLKPGEYEVEWDASNYPSGVYFYTLSADMYKMTKKMMLIK